MILDVLTGGNIFPDTRVYVAAAVCFSIILVYLLLALVVDGIHSLLIDRFPSQIYLCFSRVMPDRFYYSDYSRSK